MQSLRETRLVVVDVETSGINPFRHDVLTLAFVPIDDALPELQVFVSHLHSEWSQLRQENFLRFRDEWTRNAVPAPDACTAIEDYAFKLFGGQGVTLVGHNVGFDVSFLRKLAFQGGRDQLANISHRALDTHTLLYLLFLEGKIPFEATTSDGAFRHFGIQVATERRHLAIEDARATKKLFVRVLGALEEGTRRQKRYPEGAIEMPGVLRRQS